MYLNCWAARRVSLGGGDVFPRCYIPAYFVDVGWEMRQQFGELVHSVYCLMLPSLGSQRDWSKLLKKTGSLSAINPMGFKTQTKNQQSTGY